ncbi:dihydrofolate reductase [Clostridium hydrogeniformans]|uniref:dihydrofolate reductase n=1 Tax=Clostridium hydrogeniformans TaxID=349933 RepID=UPI0004889688|nr:dihydrofolate reductase [Clostridium hydrogeniformans]
MLSAIVAISSNNVIGRENKLLWHISEDLKRFKKITEGHTIIMGRKTFESLPGVLPNRPHIVLTRDKDYEIHDERVKVVHSLDRLHSFIEGDEEVFVIGGGEIYSLLMPYTNKIYLTKVHKEYEGDTKFPELDMNIWEIAEKTMKCDENLTYEFITLVRNK